MNDFVLAGVGLLILLFAGDALVKGAVNLSLRLGVPALIVSLTIVAFGTSAPELLIAVQAVLDDAPGLAIGNVVGSNIANVLLVLGLPAILTRLATRGTDSRKAFLVMIAANILFIAMCFLSPLTWVHGLVLLTALALVLADSFRDARSHMRAETDVPEGADAGMTVPRIAIFLALGLIGLPLGADLLVDASVNIAQSFGIPETVIGLTLVAVGTSLPELATTIMAAYRRSADVALGSVIGSNMFNLLSIMGVAALFGPFPVSDTFLQIDLWVMLGASLLLAPVVLGRYDLGRRWGIFFAGLYVLYLWILLIFEVPA
ncbi:MAG: calcium/sodium antiporter [Litoreibacter sp.]|nr:calcium/sodium antiporter [Litoreibacter sp.]